MPKHCKESDIKTKTVICPVCLKKFERKLTSGKRYCSDECRAIAINEHHDSNNAWKARVNELRQAKNNLSPEVVNEGYKYLRAAVLEQAVADYANALIKRHSGSVTYFERWFLSEWGQAYSENNGEKIIARVRKECGREKRL